MLCVCVMLLLLCIFYSFFFSLISLEEALHSFDSFSGSWDRQSAENGYALEWTQRQTEPP